MERSPVIIDTDPGVDDVLAILLALASPALSVQVITTVFGNTEVENTTRNLFTLMDVLEKEANYIKQMPTPDGKDPVEWELEKEILSKRFHHSRPIIAVGTDKPIKASSFHATYFHGLDGLGEIHTTHPHFTSSKWDSTKKLANISELSSHSYTISSRSAKSEILHQLHIAPPFTVTIIALGPLTNLALAYEEDPHTFSRVKRVITMGGAIDMPGNTTATAEFNFFADPDAIDLLTKATKGFVPEEDIVARIERLERGEIAPLHLTVMPTDVTSKILLPKKIVTKYITPIQSPLASFLTAFLTKVFQKMDQYFGTGDILEMHDPTCVAIAVDFATKQGCWQMGFTDLRIETQGLYTRGMCVVDKRPKTESSEWEELQSVEKAIEIWSSKYATNVEICQGCESGRFLREFVRGVLNVELEEDELTVENDC